MSSSTDRGEAPVSWDFTDSRSWMARVRSGLGPVMITCAVNGGEQGRESHPNLPETPEQIAEQVALAHEAGACAVHVHPRDPRNLAVTAKDAESFAEVNQLIRAACPDIIINNTTGASIDPQGRTYFGILDALPEMASLNLGPEVMRMIYRARPESLPHPAPERFYDDILPWTTAKMEQLASEMRARDIKPEMEIYHPGQYHVSQMLIDAGLIRPPYVHQFVMGFQNSIYPTPANVISMAAELPAGSLFFVAGISQFQLPLSALALVLGGHVRVGLEDNLYYRRGQKLAGSSEAVRRVVRLAEELQRPVATSAQARDMLGLSPTPRAYGAMRPSAALLEQSAGIAE